MLHRRLDIIKERLVNWKIHVKKTCSVYISNKVLKWETRENGGK